MALSVTAAGDTTTTPPSVRLDLVDPANAVTSATVLRLLSDGTSATVRTPDGNPVTLADVGGQRVGSVVDYEAPFGQPVTYVANGTAVAGPINLNVAVPWLVHPGNPGLSVPIELRPRSFESRSRGGDRGVFRIIGRGTPLVVTAGVRRSHESSLVVHTETFAELAALDRLLDDDSVVLLNVPTTLDLGVRTDYVSIGDMEEIRPSDIGSDPYRDWALPYIVTDAPLGGTGATSPGGGGDGGTTTRRPWSDLQLEASTGAAAAVLYATWDDAAFARHRPA